MTEIPISELFSTSMVGKRIIVLCEQPEAHPSLPSHCVVICNLERNHRDLFCYDECHVEFTALGKVFYDKISVFL